MKLLSLLNGEDVFPHPAAHTAGLSPPGVDVFRKRLSQHVDEGFAVETGAGELLPLVLTHPRPLSYP